MKKFVFLYVGEHYILWLEINTEILDPKEDTEDNGIIYNDAALIDFSKCYLAKTW